MTKILNVSLWNLETALRAFLCALRASYTCVQKGEVICLASLPSICTPPSPALPVPPPTTRRVRTTHGKQIPTLTPSRKDFILEATHQLFFFYIQEQRDIQRAEKNANFESRERHSNSDYSVCGCCDFLEMCRRGSGARGDCDRTKNIFFR